MSEIVNKIKYAMSLRTPQEEALAQPDPEPRARHARAEIAAV